MNERAKSIKKIVLLHIENVRGITTSLLEPQGITVADKPTKTLRRDILNLKEKSKRRTEEMLSTRPNARTSTNVTPVKLEENMLHECTNKKT